MRPWLSTMVTCSMLSQVRPCERARQAVAAAEDVPEMPTVAQLPPAA